MAASPEHKHIEGAARRTGRRPISEVYKEQINTYNEKYFSAQAFKRQESWVLRKMLQGKKLSPTDINQYNQALDAKKAAESAYNRAKELWNGSMTDGVKVSVRKEERYDFDLVKSPASLSDTEESQANLVAQMDKARKDLPLYVKGFSGLGVGLAILLSPLILFLKVLGVDAPYSLGVGLAYNAGFISGSTMVDQGLSSGGGLRAALPSSVIEAVVPLKVSPAPSGEQPLKSDSLSDHSSQGSFSDVEPQETMQRVVRHGQDLDADGTRWEIQAPALGQGTDFDSGYFLLKKYNPDDEVVESWRIYNNHNPRSYYNEETGQTSIEPPQGSADLVKSILGDQAPSFGSYR